MRSVALNRIDTARICPESGRLRLERVRVFQLCRKRFHKPAGSKDFPLARIPYFFAAFPHFLMLPPAPERGTVHAYQRGNFSRFLSFGEQLRRLFCFFPTINAITTPPCSMNER